MVWNIDWFICRADPDDVKFAKTEGRTIAVGDELWRVPISIGPIGTDHNHWAGYHLTGEPEDWHLAAAAPVMLSALDNLIEAIADARDRGEDIPDWLDQAEDVAIDARKLARPN